MKLKLFEAINLTKEITFDDLFGETKLEVKGECDKCGTKNVLLYKNICRRCRLTEYKELKELYGK